MTSPRRTMVVVLALSAGGCSLQSSTRPTPPRNDVAEAARLSAEGEKHMKAEAYEKAAESYERALAASREVPFAWHNLGVAYMKLGRNLDAVEAFRVASDLSPTDPRPPANTGLVYQKLGWAEDALRHYELALARDPSYRDALRGAVAMAQVLGKSESADLDRVRRATIAETDARWLEIFRWEEKRIEQAMRDRGASTQAPAASGMTY